MAHFLSSRLLRNLSSKLPTTTTSSPGIAFSLSNNIAVRCTSSCMASVRPILGPAANSNYNNNQYFYTSAPTQRHDLNILENIKQLPSSPAIALILGAGGLIPFAAAPYLMFESGVFIPDIAVYQNLYGATILSFLGGVRWGLTIPPGSSQSPDITNLGYSVIPQLWAWSALAAGHYMDCVVVGNVGVLLGIAATGYADLAMIGYPGWFKGLRFCLTLGAILSMGAALVCKLTLEEEGKNVQETEAGK